MPICVNELLIKVTLTDDLQTTPEGSGNNQNSDTFGTDAIVQTCVEQVISILEEKMER